MSTAAALFKRPIFGRSNAPKPSNSDLRRHTAATDSVICLLDRRGVITAITGNAVIVLGTAFDRATELNLRLADLLDAEDTASLEARLASLLETVAANDAFRLRCRAAGTAIRWFDISGRNMFADPDVDALLVELRDVTETAEQQALDGIISAAFRDTPDRVVITDRMGVVRWVNGSFERITGYRSEECIGRTTAMLKSGRHRAEFYEGMWGTLTAGRPFAAEFINRRRNGVIYHEDMAITPIRDAAGEITHYVSIGRDITERKALEVHAEDRAYFDELTGVSNPRLLRERSRQLLALARRHGKSAALVHIDINRLRSLNQTHGRDVGDAILCSVADRLKQGLRESDTLARLAGDEFLVLLSEVADEESTARVVRRLKDSVCKPYRINDRTLTLEAHVGVAMYPADATTFDELTQCAENAMSRARHSTTPFEFYRTELSELAHQKLSLEDDLSWAWDHDQFVLHYQPIVGARTGLVLGAEALARGNMTNLDGHANWPKLDGGMMSPAHFIPLAERTGRIVALDRWAIATAVKQASAWGNHGWSGWVSVNLSARSLHDADLPAYIARTLDAQGLQPERLVVEVTESSAMRDPAATAAVLRALKQVGVIVAVDDFGIGHSSLAYLKHFPVDVLKLDASFIRDIGVDSKDELLLEVMIGLAHRIGAEVVAEGVETQNQRDWLTDAGCDYIQGYLVGRPAPPEALAKGTIIKLA
ncbi:MAG: EAL domain-containing protein [Longimicrobiales bacterium]